MKIDVAELREQFTKLKTWLIESKAQIGKMNTGVTTFVSETQSTFQGEAGDGMRACMTDIFTPLYQQFEVTEQTLTQAADTIKHKAESYFGANGIVDEAYLDEWLNQVERTVRDFDYMSDDIDAQVGSVNDLISVSKINRDVFHEPLHVMKKHVTEVKSQMKDFEAEANTLTNQVSTEVNKLTSMLKEVSRFNGDMSTYKSGNFKFQQLSMRKMSEKEQKFLDNLKQQYGFDEKTSQIILETYLKSRGYVDMLHTTSGAYSELNENDYTAFFSRLMSQVAYPGLAWTALGGGTGLSFVDTMKTMGMNEDDTLHLKSMLILQYSAGKTYTKAIEEKGTGKDVLDALAYLKSQGYGSDTDLFNQFCGKNGTFTGKIDFGHQMVVTAVCLKVPTGKDSFEADASSWLGDTNGVGVPIFAPGVPSGVNIRVGDRGMDNPDYKADLDGYNLATDQLSNEDKSFLDVTNEYYDKIALDKQGFDSKTRASEFLYHKGFHAESKRMPWDQKKYNKSYNEMCKQGIEEIKWSHSQNSYKKDNYPTTEYINFIKSLESNSNNYIE